MDKESKVSRGNLDPYHYVWVVPQERGIPTSETIKMRPLNIPLFLLAIHCNIGHDPGHFHYFFSIARIAFHTEQGKLVQAI